MIEMQKLRGRRAASTTFAVAIAALVAPSAAVAEAFVPGVTDFPSRPAYVQADSFVPGVTDFPSRPGYVEAGWTPPQAASTASVALADGFDWADAGVGAALAAVAVAALSLTARTRRLRHG